MKTLSDNGSGSNNNWLGFSLSPHMKMEVTNDPHHRHDHHHHFHHHSQASAAGTAVNVVPTSFYGSGICFGVGESEGFHAPPLSVMPLKSDGSLCIMEALSRSQSEGIYLHFSVFFFLAFLVCFVLYIKTFFFILRDCTNFISKTRGLSRWCNNGNSSIWKP